jgi:hypothetical protein
MRKGTRDATWGLLVLITATGCASREPAEADEAASPSNHDGYWGSFNDDYWGGAGAQARDQRIQEPG